MKKRPLIIAHRGLFNEKADAVELDVRCTKDQVLVVSHDDRLTLRGIKISSLTYEELLQHDLAIPKVSDVIASYPTKTIIELDLKSTTADLPLAKLLDTVAKPERIFLCSPSLAVLNRYSVHFTHSAHVYSTGTTFDPLNISHGFFGRLLLFFIPLLISAPARIVFKRRVQKLLPDYITLQERFCTQQDVDFYHSLGVRVFVFVVNTQEKMERFIHMGVDGITTDKPELLFAVCETV